MAMDYGKLLFDIAKVGAQRYAPLKEPVLCEGGGCKEPATETRPIPVPPFARHYCRGCAADRRP